MKRYIYGLLITLGLLIPTVNLAAPATVGATDIFKGICSGGNDTKTNAGVSDVCKEQKSAAASKKNPIINALSIAINIIAYVIGIASVIVIIISGFRMVTSRGDSQSVASARTAIIYAVIGLAIALLAGTVVAIVLNNL
jgi:hypothetical protein